MSVNLTVIPALNSLDKYLFHCCQLVFRHGAGDLMDNISDLPESEYFLPEELDEDQSQEDYYGNKIKQCSAVKVESLVSRWMKPTNVQDLACLAFLERIPMETPCLLYFR